MASSALRWLEHWSRKVWWDPRSPALSRLPLPKKAPMRTQHAADGWHAPLLGIWRTKLYLISSSRVEVITRSLVRVAALMHQLIIRVKQSDNRCRKLGYQTTEINSSLLKSLFSSPHLHITSDPGILDAAFLPSSRITLTIAFAAGLR